MNAVARGQEFLDQVTFGEGINFDKYLNDEDKSLVRDAKYFQDALKERQLNPQLATGLKLPWREVTDFRIRPHETTIHSGYNGHMKSLQLGFIQLGLIAQGEKCLSFSMEMPPLVTLERQLRQFVGFEEPPVRMHEEFFDFLHGNYFLYDQIGTVKWKRILAVCKYAIQELGVTQCFIDSLMKCGIKSKDYETQATFLDEVTTIGKNTGAHMHVVAHAKKPEDGQEWKPPTKYQVSGSADISNLVDNVIIHHTDKREEKKADQYFIVEKQRNPEGDEAEPSYSLAFDKSSLQFKKYSGAMKLSPEDWRSQRWQ